MSNSHTEVNLKNSSSEINNTKLSPTARGSKSGKKAKIGLDKLSKKGELNSHWGAV